MKIKTTGIPAEGLQVTKSLEPVEIGLADEDVTCLAPLEITAKVERIRNTVIVQTEVKMKTSLACSRCLEDVERETTDHFKFEYVVESNTEFIDIGKDIRQEIILSLPAKVLCREDCRGLCLHCGANLNEEECRCSK